MSLLLSGLPGPMATEVALLALEAGETLCEVGLAGRTREEGWQGPGGVVVRLIGPPDRHGLKLAPGIIAVDFSTPVAALDNIRWYVDQSVPFVLGTTGFDAEAARRIVESGEVPAIIAPNMAAPIVVLQAAVRHVAERFPGALSQYSLAVEESHQAAKRDVSGTALQLLGGFRALGLNLSTKAIVSHRDPEYQSRVLGVPEAHLHGHGWHWYRAHSADGSVALELSHRINGRRVYAEGALTAVRFLRRQIAQGCRGRVFSMLEVLEGAE